MRHLVTGGAGVIGFELVRQLLEQGDTVTTVDVGKKGGLADLEALAARHPGRLELRRGDFAQDRALLKGSFDAFFHVAAIVGGQYVTDHPYETMAVNMRTTLNALDAALESGCRTFFFASSSENYAASVDRGLAPIPTPEDVLLACGEKSNEVLNEIHAADKSPNRIVQRIIEDFLAFRAEVIPWTRVGEQAFLNARRLPFEFRLRS